MAELGPESPERNRKQTRETLPTQSARRGRAAAEQGRKRSYWIAVWMLSLLLPILPSCSSWCWRSGSCCSCCSRCSCLSWRACSSRASRASRSTIARFIFGAKSAECFERGAFFRKIRSPSCLSVPFWSPGGLRERFWSLRERFWEPFWLIFTIFLMFFASVSAFVFRAFSSCIFLRFSSLFLLFFAPRAKGRHANNATLSTPFVFFSRCALAPAPPARRRNQH